LQEIRAVQSKTQCALAFKQETICLVNSGQPVMQATSTLGMSHQMLDNWLRADKLGKLSGAGVKVVAPEQMETVRLCTENARLKMKRDILKKWHISLENLREICLDDKRQNHLDICINTPLVSSQPKIR
jgi:transposase